MCNNLIKILGISSRMSTERQVLVFTRSVKKKVVFINPSSKPTSSWTKIMVCWSLSQHSHTHLRTISSFQLTSHACSWTVGKSRRTHADTGRTCELHTLRSKARNRIHNLLAERRQQCWKWYRCIPNTNLVNLSYGWAENREVLFPGGSSSSKMDGRRGEILCRELQ